MFIELLRAREKLFRASEEDHSDAPSWCSGAVSSIRFHPKIQASTEKAPGPSNASAAPSTPMKVHRERVREREMPIQIVPIATTVPATGVHKPSISKPPNTIDPTSKAAEPLRAPSRSILIAGMTSVVPAVNRNRSRPTPGAP
jgi:hypothetical protein